MGKAFPYLGQLVLLSLITLGLHFLYHSITKELPLWDTAHMQLWQIYALQFLLSALVVVAVVGIGNSMPNNLGFVFLGFLTLKIAANYLVLRPVLNAGSDASFFKYNFLIVFFLFMIFDVYVTYRVLNQTYPSKNK